MGRRVAFLQVSACCRHWHFELCLLALVVDQEAWPEPLLVQQQSTLVHRSHCEVARVLEIALDELGESFATHAKYLTSHTVPL